MGRRKVVVLRFVAAFSICILARLGGDFLAMTTVSSRLDLLVLGSFVTGLLFGPVGIAGFCLALLLTGVGPETSLQGPISFIILATGYALVGSLAYVVFRFGKRLRCTLDDLRSYLAFVGVALVGSLVIATIGSSQLFLRLHGATAFWNGVLIWIASSATTILIAGPLLILGLCRLSPPWLLVRSPVDAVPMGRRVEGIEDRRYLLRITAMVLGVTLVVIPLVRLQPELQIWLMLLYLIPVLWTSVYHGMQSALLTASVSGIAYLVGSEVWALLASGSSTHESILAEYAGLVMIAVIGAITGGFQQERLGAERALLVANANLEARSESLRLVNRLTDRLHRTLNVRSIAIEAAAALERLSEAPLTAFYLLDETAEHLDLIVDEGYDEEAVSRHARLPLAGSLSGLAIGGEDPMVVQKPADDERVTLVVRETLKRHGIGTMVLIPIVFEGRPLGSLNLGFQPGRKIESADLATLKAIGHTVALAIVNARQFAELHHQAHHDSLTDLPNRLELHRIFADVLADHRAGDRVGLALLDLDRFKEVNDALGHRTGDELLKRIASRLDAGLEDGVLHAFRLGGDEFSLVLPKVRDAGDGAEQVGRVLADLKQPYDIEGMRLEINTSAGLSLYPDHGADSHELLRCADVAMYQAKESPADVAVYSAELDQHTPQRLRLASQLGEAINSDQLLLYYQPKVSLADGATVGFEALVRWRHPRQGLLVPKDFVPLAEVSDLIHPLTEWVTRAALAQLAVWSEIRPGLSMAINLSARSLLDLNLAEGLRRAIGAAGVRSADVQLELTETALLSDPVTSARTLGELTEMGVGIAIDDFGTGYSSLALLKSLSIQALKIDRSFIADVLRDEKSRAIVEATIQLAGNLGAEAIAEGVENRETAEALLEMGCELAQGYHFAHPASAADIDLRSAE